ncbi:MAG: ornithine carbamoyltransferase [Candidatus Izemoplasmatales bacterium]|uniref:Ornithine carbamoyltransferase n=1 Tax=Hujiaoplasma nucleasis TaxID=2725268 RepID=A0A7L6N251_9MOLU|nr:ornithine carbamoyltransferase [Hujiaoplasma nucleasis]QLY39512.1 ornithine carbamoyltransferase [Hujiaoplasma nucleasis]
MKPEFKGKHFITLEDWSKEEIERLLEVSKLMKDKFLHNEDTSYLKNKTAFLMFFEQSTRTRNSMEAGIAQLGGHGNYLDTSGMQISHGESAKDTAVILSSYGHGIACRNCFWGIGNKYLREMAQHSTVPVMNLQCDLYHPMQGLADLMTIQEVFPKQNNIKVSIIWAYARSHKKPISVPLTQILLFPRFGMDVTLAYPEGYDLPDWAIEKARANAKENNGSFRITHNMEEAFKDADVVIPKNWGSWVNNQSTEVVDDLLESYKSWKCTEEMMALANNNVKYMHALPADRGNEVENSVIDGPHSIVYQEAENRLHTAKAVMAMTMGDK